MGWTNWRRIADHGICYIDVLDHDGPAVYELAVAGPRGGALQTVYVGETVNERSRIKSYAEIGSHLSKEIRDHLRNGWSLWYRAQAVADKHAAVVMQNRLLARFDYHWNIHRNR